MNYRLLLCHYTCIFKRYFPVKDIHKKNDTDFSYKLFFLVVQFCSQNSVVRVIGGIWWKEVACDKAYCVDVPGLSPYCFQDALLQQKPHLSTNHRATLLCEPGTDLELSQTQIRDVAKIVMNLG